MKTALITGITGQDGSYLTELLLNKKYIVHGIVRRSSNINTKRIDHLIHDENLILHYGDVTDGGNLIQIMNQIKPDEIYNLAAQSHVKVSFELPELTSQIDAIGVLKILECIRTLGLHRNTRFFQASTSELYGKVFETPQTEETPFYPRSPYGVAKLYAYWIVRNYREAYNLHASSGILFNHESPRRGDTFVTKKIVDAFRKMRDDERVVLRLGNLNALRDWGHAKDYVEAMWLMLQRDLPSDYVIASGQQYSVRQFVEEAAQNFGYDIIWKGKDIDEYAIDADTGRVLVIVDKKYFRPTEVDSLIGDSSRARWMLGWKPKYDFKSLVKEMCYGVQ